MTALQAPGGAEASLGIVRDVSHNALFILGDLSSRETCFPKKIYGCLFFNTVQRTGQVCQPVEVSVFYGVQPPHRKSIRVTVKFKKSYILNRNLDCYSVIKRGRGLELWKVGWNTHLNCRLFSQSQKFIGSLLERTSQHNMQRSQSSGSTRMTKHPPCARLCQRKNKSCAAIKQ